MIKNNYNRYNIMKQITIILLSCSQIPKQTDRQFVNKESFEESILLYDK